MQEVPSRIVELPAYTTPDLRYGVDGLILEILPHTDYSVLTAKVI